MKALLHLPVIIALTGQSIFAQHIDTTEIKNRIDSLIRLADTYNGEMDNVKALEVIREAEALHLEYLGTGTILYGEICHILGRSLKVNADFTMAEKYITKAIDIRKRILGKDHLDYLKSLGNLGSLYFEIGDYDQSEPVLLEVVSGFARLEDWVSHSQVLSNLAIMYQMSGNYQKCESAFLQSLDYWEREQKLEHPFYLVILGNLARLYVDMGNFEKGESILLHYFELQDRLDKPNPISYATALTTMSNIYAFKKEPDKEENMLLKCLSIEKEVYDRDHPELGATLANLGNFYMRIGRYDEAEKYLKEGFSILDKSFGPVSETSARNRMNLADLARARGDFEEADSLYLETRDLIKRVFRPQHEMNRSICWSMTSFYYDRHDYHKAVIHLLELIQFSEERIRNASNHLSTGEMEHYLSSFQGADHLLYSILFDLNKQEINLRDMINQISELGFDLSLTRKMYLMLNERQMLGFSKGDSLLSSKFQNLKSLHRELAYLYTLPGDHQEKTGALSDNINKLEKELMIASSDFRVAGTRVTWDSLQKELDDHEIVIEFVHFKYQNELSDSILYAALLLGPGYRAPQFIPLFEERQLVGLLDSLQWRNEAWMSQKDEDNGMNILHDLIWSPLIPYLEAVQHIHYSPSGLLHRMPLMAIPSKDGGLLGDRFTFHQLGSSRQLYINRNVPSGDMPPSSTASVFGGIHYEMDSTAILSANQNFMISDSTDLDLLGAGLRASIRSSTYSPKGWSYLPWTEVESKTIAAIVRQQGIKVDLFSGFQATEDHLHYLGVHKPSPRILHFATHGYFFPDPGNDPAAGSTNEPAFKVSEHPMIRSGLIMAGANHVWTGGTPLKNLEDGILTAYEVSQLDLSETELVVLSACETGLGDIRGDEGVYGLQRAFKIAGARYLIMSLWQVPDFATQELMTLFYTYWLKEKMELPDAFRKAQQAVREKKPDPFYWAGFVLVE